MVVIEKTAFSKSSSSMALEVKVCLFSDLLSFTIVSMQIYDLIDRHKVVALPNQWLENQYRFLLGISEQNEVECAINL